MGTLTPQPMDYAGTNITFVAAGVGVGFDVITTPGNRIFLWAKSTAGVTRTVTIVVDGFTFEQNNPDVAIAIPTLEERMIGPLVPALGSVSANGGVVITYSSLVNVTVAAVELPSPLPGLP